MLAPGRDLSKLILAARKPSNSAKKKDEGASVPNDTDEILTFTSDESDSQNSLYHHLLRVRKERAIEMECAPFHLASNQALIDMSSVRPSAIPYLKSSNIDGFTELKIQRDGKFWIDQIVSFCKDNNLPMDVQPSQNSIDEGGLKQLSLTAEATYVKFQKQKMSIEQVATDKKLARSTIIGYLSQALDAGYPLDLVRAGVPDFIQEIIQNVISSPPINSNIGKLSPIKEQCPDYVTYDQIKLVVAYLRGLQRSTSKTTTMAPQSVQSATITKTASISQPGGFTLSSFEYKSQKRLTDPCMMKECSDESSSSTKEGVSNSFWNKQNCKGDKIDESASNVESEGNPSLSKHLRERINKNVEPDACDLNETQLATQIDGEESGIVKTETDASDLNEALLASQIDWDEEMFETKYSAGSSFQDSDHPGDLVSETLERSASHLGVSSTASSEECDSTLKRSISEDVTSKASPQKVHKICGTDDVKRKLPEWLSKPNAKAEVRKKMKSNSLFKL